MICKYQRIWIENLHRWDIINSMLASEIKSALGVGCLIRCNAEVCEIELESEDKEKLDVLVATHKDKAYDLSLPSGHHVFQIPVETTKWGRFKETIMFLYRLGEVPSSITLSNVLFAGTSDLQIEEIATSGFMFSVKSIGRGEQLGPNGVEFDWEVVP